MRIVMWDHGFFEREFIEIKRKNHRMNIVGTLTGSVEREDVRQLRQLLRRGIQ